MLSFWLTATVITATVVAILLRAVARGAQKSRAA